MKGSIAIPFSELFADTVTQHGAAWARVYYMARGMASWEFRFWLGQFRKVG